MNRNSKRQVAAQAGRRSGLTLIELLVVIMILGIIMVLAIPRLRMISEDRSVREAARVAGSVFAKASQRAITDGVAGVCIELNPNILDVDNVQYAGTALYMMRALPTYSGDDLEPKAQRYVDNSLPTETFVFIPLPYQFNPADIYDTRNVIQLNDYISFNFSSVRYQIAGLEPNQPNPGQLKIRLVSDLIKPPLPGGDGLQFPFVVYRQPKVDENSRVELPEGYVIDMRFSGELKASITSPASLRDTLPLTVSGSVPIRTVFHDPVNGVPIRNRATRLLFDADGSIDRYYYPLPSANAISYFKPESDLYFLIAKYETKVNREQIRSGNKMVLPPDDVDPLDNPNNMWLTVNVRTGSSNISYNAPPAINLSLAQRIRQARSIAVTGSSAGD